MSLELGGNAPCIIFDDADVDVAVKGAVSEIIDQLYNMRASILFTFSFQHLEFNDDLR